MPSSPASHMVDGASPVDSQPVDLPDTQATSATTVVMQSLSQPEPVERSQLISPAPVEGPSLTPPPSSQVPTVSKNGSNTPAPAVTNFLASPPQTTQAPDGHVAATSLADPPSASQVDAASIEELRRMVSDLSIALNEARTSAAHYKLQYSMLQIESRESQNRMAVELDMAHREVDVLQAAEERRKQEYMSPTQTAADVTNAHALLNEMTAHSSRLQSENDRLHELVAQLDRQLLYKTGEIEDKNSEIKRLRDRIRQNREHMTGFLDNLSENNTTPSVFGTPRRTPHAHGTPRSVLPSVPRLPHSSSLENPGLEAILLADKVLSQETATQPSTPSRSPLKPRGHTRGTQSLSSLPSTPTRPASMRSTAAHTHRTPPHSLAAILEPPLPLPPPQPRPPPFSLAPGPGAPQYAAQQAAYAARRRRASSDSTITASSVEDERPPPPHAHPGSQARDLERVPDARSDDGADDDDVPESQASQAATSMLRATPVEKGGSARSSFQAINAAPPAPRAFVQTKLTGRVVKAVSAAAAEASPEKRRLASYGEAAGAGSPTKKSRVEGVGLGIGMAGGPAK